MGPFWQRKQGLAVFAIAALLLIVINTSTKSVLDNNSIPESSDPDIKVKNDTGSVKTSGRTGSDEQVTTKKESSRKKWNVLMVMTDDMRAQLGAYGGPDSEYDRPLVTPNLDAFGSRSLVLRNAHVQYTLCGPSRASILTGRRPDTTKVYTNHVYWREAGGNFTTIPQYFQHQGYNVVGMGKILHKFNDPISWSSEFIKPVTDLEQKYWPLSNGSGWRGVQADEDSEHLPDQMLVNNAKDVLTKLASNAKSENEPFFLAFGFTKPHLNFVCPKKFFDLYPLEKEERFLSRKEWQTPYIKPGNGAINTTLGADRKEYLPHETLRLYRQAYFGCVSYVDSLFGDIMKTVDDLGLRDSTIVSFMSDHGYHLGENGEFGKMTQGRPATHVPMMLHVPGRTDSGVVSDSPVEGVDLFPTLVEAAGFEDVPKCSKGKSDVDLCVQGKSLLPLIENPVKDIKPAAISQLGMDRGFGQYSVITKRYRLTECLQHSALDGRHNVEISQKKICTNELYDRLYDREEATNVITMDKYADIRKDLEENLLDVVKNL